MRSVRQFTVIPAIPPSLQTLTALAMNLHWTWDRETQALFERLDPAVWESTGHDPLRLLGEITNARWNVLATDPAIISACEAASARLADAVSAPRWFQGRDDTPLSLVAYFAAEFGLSETLPQYSGGLGILAGDHLKAASDLGIPLVAVGLLYAEGYFRQRLNADAWQEERYPLLDPHGLALHPTGITIGVDIAGEHVAVRVWRVQVGRITLLLLDTAVEGNGEIGSAITDRLYGGDNEHRLRQEIVLGIGGVRALRALGLTPQVFHTNEGHAGFLSLERIRELVAGGLPFAAAVEAVRAGGVFTTHTPVPAGIDRFPRDLMERYFTTFSAGLGVTFDELFALGQRDDENDGKFNMAVMGLRLSGRSNGVARLHGEVSREMFHGLWPEVALDEVPIGSITNGVHAHTWVGNHIAPLLAEGVGPVWDGADAASWNGIDRVAGTDIVAARAKGRRELVEFVRTRCGDGLLDPEALTIGFARRFATYKRATLLLSQPERLKRLLLDADRPVQFVFAGKAHPADHPGKDMIREIELFARQLDVGHRFVFVPDYDMAIARMMYHGCDVWLNNPRRPLEACGTSGMKAALNGALNCSILDGWWDECFNGTNGWAIASAEDDADLARRDQREATSLFGLLEREIVPLFYDHDSDGVPTGWVDRMKDNWRSLGPFVTAARMVRDYTTDLYEPAAASSDAALDDHASAARELADWKQRVRITWPVVRVFEVESDTTPAHEGDVRSVTARVDVGAIDPEHLAVQVLHGRINSEGSFLGQPTIVTLERSGDQAWSGKYVVGEAGPYGMTVRAVPVHPSLVSPVEVGLVAWAE